MCWTITGDPIVHVLVHVQNTFIQNLTTRKQIPTGSRQISTRVRRRGLLRETLAIGQGDRVDTLDICSIGHATPPNGTQKFVNFTLARITRSLNNKKDFVKGE